jgi:hypothetical protein
MVTPVGKSEILNGSELLLQKAATIDQELVVQDDDEHIPVIKPKKRSTKATKSIDTTRKPIHPSQLDVYMLPAEKKRESSRPKKRKLKKKVKDPHTDENSEKTFKL